MIARLLLATLLLTSSAAELSAQGNTAKAPASPAPAPPTVVFMTDFGTANDAAAICRAVIVGIVPGVRIMDVTHQVTPYSIEEAARFLEGVTPYYPGGTVFLVVVDPGVGTSRKAVVVRTRKGQYFVLPDNGIITPVLDRDTLDAAREITNPAWMIGDRISSTFHGRDVFSPTAAHLAAGEDWTAVGPEVKDLVRLRPRVARVGPRGIEAEVIGLDDPYGNIITDVRAPDLKRLGYKIGDRVNLAIDGKRYRFPFVRTFGDVAVGEPLLYIDSRGRVAFSLNERDMSKTYRITPPASVTISAP